MRKSASDLSTVGENKNKMDKLHLATCHLNRSQLQFHLFVTWWSYKWTPPSPCCSGSDLAGDQETDRQTDRHVPGRPFQVRTPPGSTGETADHRPARCEDAAARGKEGTRGQRARRVRSPRGVAQREHRRTPSLEGWLLQGPPWPWPRPWCDRHPSGAGPAESMSPFALRSHPAALVSLRDVSVLLVVGFGRRRVAFLL